MLTPFSVFLFLQNALAWTTWAEIVTVMYPSEVLLSNRHLDTNTSISHCSTFTCALCSNVETTALSCVVATMHLALELVVFLRRRYTDNFLSKQQVAHVSASRTCSLLVHVSEIHKFSNVHNLSGTGRSISCSALHCDRLFLLEVLWRLSYMHKPRGSKTTSSW